MSEQVDRGVDMAAVAATYNIDKDTLSVDGVQPLVEALGRADQELAQALAVVAEAETNRQAALAAIVAKGEELNQIGETRRAAGATLVRLAAGSATLSPEAPGLINTVRGTLSHLANTFEQAKLEVKLPDEATLTAVVQERPELMEALDEEGSELLLVPTGLTRDQLREGLGTLLRQHPELSQRVDTQTPVLEWEGIAQEIAAGTLVMEPKRFDRKKHGGQSVAEYEARATALGGWDVMVVTADGNQAEIPSRNRGKNPNIYLGDINRGELEAMGTYQEYLTLALTHAARGEIIDTNTVTWLPDTFLAGRGKVARAYFSDDRFYLSAWDPSADGHFGFRRVVRAKV